MNPKNEKRLNPCQSSDAYTKRNHYFIRLLNIFVLIWLALGVIYFVRG
mgnify:CR=1 FL=1